MTIIYANFDIIIYDMYQMKVNTLNGVYVYFEGRI